MNVRDCAHCAARGYAWLAVLPGIVGAEPAEDIRDIRGPKSVTESWLLPAILAAAVLVAALGGFLVWRRRHRAGRRPALNLWERTLERLDGIRPMMRPDAARAFGIAVSEVIREYIEQRFRVVATQRTTEEFLQALLQSSSESLALRRPLLANFLHQCDFVKFAGDTPSAVEMQALFDSARRFVLETGEALPA